MIAAAIMGAGVLVALAVLWVAPSLCDWLARIAEPEE